MNYVRVPWEDAVETIAQAINKALEDGPVLLLLSGGSNVRTGVALRERLNLKNELTIGLTDERYGPPGHPDSNWQQLLDAGFDTKKLKLMPVLEGKSVEETTVDLKDNLRQAFQVNSAIFGLFGLGEDGHTSGILPGSPAVESEEIVVNFEGPDFTRITTTPFSFRHFDAAFLVVYGENKLNQLERLKEELPTAEQPAQALKSIPELTIFNDQVGEA